MTDMGGRVFPKPCVLGHCRDRIDRPPAEAEQQQKQQVVSDRAVELIKRKAPCPRCQMRHPPPVRNRENHERGDYPVKRLCDRSPFGLSISQHHALPPSIPALPSTPLQLLPSGRFPLSASCGNTPGFP